jgi:hypothetical protein
MFPSRSCRIAAVRMYCTPTVCCVQPTAYAMALVRSRPEFVAEGLRDALEYVLGIAADSRRPCSGV